VTLTANLETGVNWLPAAFDTAIYRQLWPDLAGLDDEALQVHYDAFGAAEGRRANSLAFRGDFAALIPSTGSALEIGPFCKPLLRGHGVKYFDVMDKLALDQRARDIGLQDQLAPHIHFVSPVGDLSVVDETFDYVLSSHCLEHQPDLVTHLQQVARILRPNGRYFLLIPDKRYCFDALLAESTVAEVLDAHHAGRKTHSLKSVIEHRALTTHNDCSRHWNGDHGFLDNEGPGRVIDSVKEYIASDSGYIDVHAWYFTPISIQIFFNRLRDTDYINLDIERIYPTQLHSIEFWMILRRTCA